MKHLLERAAGRPLDDMALVRLESYRRWLDSEGRSAGGVGPGESNRLADRHIADSLAFLRLLPPGSPVLDAGSGAGLPGVPLAIVCPDREFILNDRSGRRRDLLERIVRILQLPNVRIDGADLRRRSPVPVVVARAVFPPREWTEIAQQLLLPGGTAIIAVGLDAAIPEAPPGLEIDRIVLDPTILDRPSAFLTMTASD